MYIDIFSEKRKNTSNLEKSFRIGKIPKKEGVSVAPLTEEEKRKKAKLMAKLRQQNKAKSLYEKEQRKRDKKLMKMPKMNVSLKPVVLKQENKITDISGLHY